MSIRNTDAILIGERDIIIVEAGELWLFSDAIWRNFTGELVDDIYNYIESRRPSGRLSALAEATGFDLGKFADSIAMGVVPLGPPELIGENPGMLFIELTDRCPLRCRHCYADAGPDGEQFLPRLQVQEAVGDAALLGFRVVQFTGGEPLLHPDLRNLVEVAFQSGLAEVEIFTSGVTLTEEYLLALDRRTTFALSFYSDDPRLHDSITGAPGSQEKTLGAIRLLNKIGFGFRVGVVEMSENSGRIGETIEMLCAAGADRGKIEVTPAREVGRGRFFECDRTSDEDETVAATDGAGRKNIFNFEGKAAIGVDGTVYPCIFSRWLPVGNINSRPLGEILRDPERRPGAMPPPERFDYCAARLTCSDCNLLACRLMAGGN